MRRAASWVLAVLAAGALTLSLLALFANRNVFSADGFADRTEQTLQSDAVSAELARRLTDTAIRAYPDLIAVRPLATSAAEGVVRSAALRSLVRAAARDLHRSVFDRDASTVTLAIADVGVLLNEAIRHLRPDLAGRLPSGLDVTLSGATAQATVDALEVAERVRRLAVVSLAAGLLLALGAVLAGGTTRAGVVRVGCAVAVVAGLAALLATFAAPVLTADAGAQAILETWLDPLAVWCWALFGAGLVVASAAASILRPLVLLPLLRRAGDAVVHPPDRPWPRDTAPPCHRPRPSSAPRWPRPPWVEPSRHHAASRAASPSAAASSRASAPACAPRAPASAAAARRFGARRRSRRPPASPPAQPSCRRAARSRRRFAP